METISNQRLYKIATNIPYFYTGRLSGGTQLLMGVQPPNLVSIVFNDYGDYVRTLTKQMSQGQQSTTQNQLEADVEFSAYIYQWQAELGVIPSTISIKQFYLPELFIGITDLPEHYQEVLDYPENFTEGRLQMLKKDIEEWRANGQFVLDWDEDYYMSEEGDVDST